MLDSLIMIINSHTQHLHSNEYQIAHRLSENFPEELLLISSQDFNETSSIVKILIKLLALSEMGISEKDELCVGHILPEFFFVDISVLMSRLVFMPKTPELSTMP